MKKRQIELQEQIKKLSSMKNGDVLVEHLLEKIRLGVIYEDLTEEEKKEVVEKYKQLTFDDLEKEKKLTTGTTGNKNLDSTLEQIEKNKNDGLDDDDDERERLYGSIKKEDYQPISPSEGDTSTAIHIDPDRTVAMQEEAEDVESINDKTTVLNNLRSDIQDEYTAIKGYDAHADFAEKNGCSDIAEIIRDIRDEEKVHIGELEAVMKKYDKEFKTSLNDGEKEAEKILKKS